MVALAQKKYVTVPKTIIKIRTKMSLDFNVPSLKP